MDVVIDAAGLRIEVEASVVDRFSMSRIDGES